MKIVVESLSELWTMRLCRTESIRQSLARRLQNTDSKCTTSHLPKFLAKVDLIYAAGVEAAPIYKKLVKQYYSFNGVPSDSIVRKYSNKFQKE